MTKYGATETEAERLVDLAYENTQPYSARAKAFPSNPSIGQTCVIDVTIHVDDAATAAGIASEIMAASLCDFSSRALCCQYITYGWKYDIWIYSCTPY